MGFWNKVPFKCTMGLYNKAPFKEQTFKKPLVKEPLKHSLKEPPLLFIVFL